MCCVKPQFTFYGKTALCFEWDGCGVVAGPLQRDFDVDVSEHSDLFGRALRRRKTFNGEES